jgi:hypothetical protein
MSDAAAAVAMPARNADLSMHRFIKALLRLYEDSIKALFERWCCCGYYACAQ